MLISSSGLVGKRTKELIEEGGMKVRKCFSEGEILSDRTCARPVKYALNVSAMSSGSVSRSPSSFISFIHVSLLVVLTSFLIICQVFLMSLLYFVNSLYNNFVLFWF